MEEDEEEEWDVKSWIEEVNFFVIKSVFVEEEVDDGLVKVG